MSATLWYSDHYGADGDNDQAVVSPLPILPAGRTHARIYSKVAYFKGLMITTNADIAFMMTMKSGDRLRNLRLTSDGGSDAGAVDIGLHAVVNGVPSSTALDVNLFADNQAISTAIKDVEVLDESGSITPDLRGKALWEMYAATDGSDTYDPRIEYCISMTCTDTSWTTADSKISLEAVYCSGS